MLTGITEHLGAVIFPKRPRSVALRYGVAVLLPLGALLITDNFFTLSKAPFFLPFTLSVTFAGIYGGWAPGVLCTGISALLNCLVLSPVFSLKVADAESLARVTVFAAAGLVISAFVATISSLQQNLQFEKERFRVTLTSIGDAVIATDQSGAVTFMNAIAEQATGWNFRDAAGRPLEEVFRIVNETTRKPVENPIRRVFELGRVVGLANHTMLIRRDGSEIPIDDSAAPIRDSQGILVGAVLVFRDITQQKKGEAALLQAEKLASVGKLAATIAHEINNPLEAIANLLFLIRSSQDAAEIEKYAHAAEQQLSRASEVTKQTLAFARRDASPEIVNVSDLVDGVLAIFSNKVTAKKVDILKRCDAEVCVLATKSEVRQILGNLFGNALDAIPSGGTIHIRTAAYRRKGQACARILVADTGDGIPAQHRHKVFDAFFTTKKDVGTGLGLWVAKRIVDSHNGTIHIRSTVGRGTAVRVCLPPWPGEPGSDAAADAQFSATAAH